MCKLQQRARCVVHSRGSSGSCKVGKATMLVATTLAASQRRTVVCCLWTDSEYRRGGYDFAACNTLVVEKDSFDTIRFDSKQDTGVLGVQAAAILTVLSLFLVADRLANLVMCLGLQRECLDCGLGVTCLPICLQ